MAKAKAAPKAVGNRPAHSRVSFLYQAAAMLSRIPAPPQKEHSKQAANAADGSSNTHPSPAPFQGMSRRLLTQMRAVSRKTNMRVRPVVKRTVCKYCDTLLVEGDTCVSTVENRSRGGSKPWADVLAVQCRTCGRVRRYPVAAPRQPRRPFRGGGKTAEEEEEAKGTVQAQAKAQTKAQPKAHQASKPAKQQNLAAKGRPG